MVFALAVPNRVRTNVLLAPVGIVPLRKQFFARVLAPIVLPYRTVANWSVTWFSAKDPTLHRDFFHQMGTGLMKGRFRGTVLRMFSDEELRRLKPSTLFLVGSKEVTFDPDIAIERLGSLAPQIEMEIVPDAAHSLTSDQAELVNERILRILGKHHATSKSAQGGADS